MKIVDLSSVDFSEARIAQAVDLQCELVALGQLNGDSVATDGLLTAGVDPSMVPQIAAQIAVTPEVGDAVSNGQSPFVTYYCVGRTAVSQIGEFDISGLFTDEA